jgi:5'-deoxynucleotidase YfbR-like HD superfamily hydrolase
VSQDGGWIQTFTGRQFYPLWPTLDAIALEDIAHALSLQCRFVGHVRAFYSVAQHSVLVSYACDPADALWGLLHDGSEAYLSDIASPVKRLVPMAPYRGAEAVLQRLVYQRFGLNGIEPDSVHEADALLCALEARALMGTLLEAWPAEVRHLPPSASAIRIVPWSPAAAEKKFLARFAELTTVGR